MAKKFAPKLPLELDENGNFIKIEDSLSNIKQKLKMLILTNPGEKLMDPEFGVGIRRFLFESVNGIINYNYVGDTLDSISIEDFQEKITKEIRKQVIKYANDITIYNIEAVVEGQILSLSIYYNYKGFRNDSLQLAVNL
jgi:phage baseplate assembly protein W